MSMNKDMVGKCVSTVLLISYMSILPSFPWTSASLLSNQSAHAMPAPVAAEEEKDIRPQLKVSGGSASTSAGSSSATRSVVKTVTRGMTLENADFSNSDFEGVSFQQSILRQADFSNAILRNASFFDADLSGAKFVNADMSSANVSCFYFLCYMKFEIW